MKKLSLLFMVSVFLILLSCGENETGVKENPGSIPVTETDTPVAAEPVAAV